VYCVRGSVWHETGEASRLQESSQMVLLENMNVETKVPQRFNGRLDLARGFMG